MAKKVVNMMWRDEELANLRECKELLRLNGEAETVRYLVTRGMEAMAGALQNRRFILKAEQQFTPQQMLPLFEKLGLKENV